MTCPHMVSPPACRVSCSRLRGRALEATNVGDADLGNVDGLLGKVLKNRIMRVSLSENLSVCKSATHTQNLPTAVSGQ